MMTKRERVIKGLECWSHMAIKCDSGCLYRPTDEREKVVGECDFQALCIDALELLKYLIRKETKRENTCETMCRYAPPTNKWPCVDCDIRYHDRAEPPKEETGDDE